MLVRDWLSAAPQRLSEETGPGEKKEREASLSAMFILSAPSTMMSYAIIAFILGLAIYQGFVWTKNLDIGAGKINSRNVFIAYIVSTGYCGLFFSLAGVIKAIENLLLHDRSRTKLIRSVKHNSDHVDGRRDGEKSPQLDEFPPGKNSVAPTQSIHTASQFQTAVDRSSSSGIAAALEAAAKAHILSAEADRRVASEYAKLSGL